MYRLDIACPDLKIAVECDGKQHDRRNYQISDGVRDAILGELGWSVVRLRNSHIEERFAWCLGEVLSAVAARA